MKKDRHDASRLVDYLLILPEDFAWYTGAELTGFVVSKKPDSWLLIVKATVRGQRKVAFFDAETIQDAFRYFYVNLKGGTIGWKDDRFG